MYFLQVLSIASLSPQKVYICLHVVVTEVYQQFIAEIGKLRNIGWKRTKALPYIASQFIAQES